MVVKFLTCIDIEIGILDDIKLNVPLFWLYLWIEAMASVVEYAFLVHREKYQATMASIYGIKVVPLEGSFWWHNWLDASSIFLPFLWNLMFIYKKMIQIIWVKKPIKTVNKTFLSHKFLYWFLVLQWHILWISFNYITCLWKRNIIKDVIFLWCCSHLLFVFFSVFPLLCLIIDFLTSVWERWWFQSQKQQKLTTK